MKKIFLKSVVAWVWFFGTLFLWVIVYAAWTNISTQSSGTTITHTLWNELVNNINTVWTKVDTLVPPGAIMAFNLASCPTGWIAADGTSGTPDLRGEFIRWLDNGRWVDSGRTLASSQLATRVFFNEVDDAWRAGRQVDMFDWVWVNYDGSVELAVTRASYPSLTPAWNVSNSRSYGIRVRPRNVAFLYCIKQ